MCVFWIFSSLSNLWYYACMKRRILESLSLSLSLFCGTRGETQDWFALESASGDPRWPRGRPGEWECHAGTTRCLLYTELCHGACGSSPRWKRGCVSHWSKCQALRFWGALAQASCDETWHEERHSGRCTALLRGGFILDLPCHLQLAGETYLFSSSKRTWFLCFVVGFIQIRTALPTCWRTNHYKRIRQNLEKHFMFWYVCCSWWTGEGGKVWWEQSLWHEYSMCGRFLKSFGSSVAPLLKQCGQLAGHIRFIRSWCSWPCGNRVCCSCA